jgi:hypothetical protein
MRLTWVFMSLLWAFMAGMQLVMHGGWLIGLDLLNAFMMLLMAARPRPR